MTVLRSLRVLVALITAASCAEPRPAADSTGTTAATTAAADWVTDLGQMLVIHGETDRSAIVVYPASVDTAPPIRLRMFRRGMPLPQPVTATVVADSLACGDAPMLHLQPAVPAGWTIGFAATDVTSLSVDSIEALPTADSSALAADVARLASATVRDGSRFRGLPFVVLKAYRVDWSDGEILVATTLRRLPQEASPLEERRIVIAERVPGGEGRYEIAYSLGAEGTEETAQHFVLLGVVRAGATLYAVVEREQENGSLYEILVRGADGKWASRWSRALRC